MFVPPPWTSDEVELRSVQRVPSDSGGLGPKNAAGSADRQSGSAMRISGPAGCCYLYFRRRRFTGGIRPNQEFKGAHYRAGFRGIISVVLKPNPG